MDEIQELEGLLQELLSGIQEILQSGEFLSDEFQGELAKTLNLLTSRIDQLKSESPIESLQPTTQSPEPELNESMPSSNVESFGYDDKTGRLLVRFLGKHPDPHGPVYGYEGVPKEIFELFRKGAVPARTDGKNKWGSWWKGKVPSLGASMFTLIKGGGYPYQKLS